MISQRSSNAMDSAASNKADVQNTRSSLGRVNVPHQSAIEDRLHSLDENDFDSLMSELKGEPANTSDAQDAVKRDLSDSFSSLLEQSHEDTQLEQLDSSMAQASNEPSGELNVAVSLTESEALIDAEPSELTPPADLSSLGQFLQQSEAGVESPAGSHADVASAQNTLPASETAARIFEEMRARSRHLQEQRWQFSLPGVMAGDITVTVEKLSDNSWVVELDADQECSDEELQALEQRLKERLGDVSLSATPA